MNKKYYGLFLIFILGVNIPVQEISHDHFNEELEVISCHVCESENSTNFFIKQEYIQKPYCKCS